MRRSQRLVAFVTAKEARIEKVLGRRGVFPLAVVLLAVGFATRWALVALSVPTVGPDYGHYLIAANWYAGIDRSGEGPFDPPFVPLLILALAPLLGKITVLQLLGPAALATSFAAAVFFLLRFVPRWSAVVASAVFVHWQTYLELITSGGVTNLFGIAFSLLFFRFLYDALREPRTGWRFDRGEIMASAMLFLVASTHHFTTFIVGATVLVWLGLQAMLGTQNRRAVVWSVFRVVVPAAVPSLIYLPYFLNLFTTDVASGLGQPAPLGALASAIAYAWQDTPELWLAWLGLTVLLLARFQRTTAFLPAAAALLGTPVLLVLTILASHPVRPLYFLPFPLTFLAVLWLARSEGSATLRPLSRRSQAVGRAACVGILVVALLVLPGSSQERQLDGARNYHQFMTAGTLEAFGWIDANTDPQDRFAVDAGLSPAFNDYWKGMATGWWLEGYANRRAIYEANPPLLPFLSKWEETRDANRLFAGDTIFEDGILRVADSFPLDDSAAPKIYTGYYRDFHEFLGFAVPRLVNSATGEAFTLVLGADPNYQRGLANGVGWVRGNYSGPEFAGTRSTSYEYAATTVTLRLNLSFGPGATWDAFEMTIRLPPWTLLDLALLDQGVIQAQATEVFGYKMEVGRVDFITTNLTLPSQVPPLGKPGEGGIGLRWTILDSTVTLRATVSLTRLPTTGPQRHPPVIRTSAEILRDHAIDFLFVTMDSASNIQRFDRQSRGFTRSYENEAVVIFAVN